MTSPRPTRTTKVDRNWRVRVPLPRDASRLWWWREQWRRHPRMALAIRAAVAAAVAWVVVSVLPGELADDYPYYAPFGAVIATTFTLAGSVRESLQSGGAIAVGGAVGWAVDLLPVTGPLAVGLVVVPAVLLAGWPLLGGMGGWVPTAALFTLIVGHGDGTYVGAYAGLTLLGAVIGIAVNAAAPPLPLAPAQSAVARFRRTLAGDLEELAELLEGEELPTAEDWDREHAASPRERARMQAAVAEVGEASRRNVRARRYSGSIEALRYEAATLDRLALVVQDLVDLLLNETGNGRVERSEVLDEQTRPRVRHALHTLAEALRNTTVAGTANHDGEEGQTSSADVAAAVDDARSVAPRDDAQLVVDGVIVGLRRSVDSLAEIERTD